MFTAPIVAEKNRDYIPGQLSSNVKYLRFSMAEASGTTLSDRAGNYPDMATSGSGIWTNLPGWLRPEHTVTRASLTQAQVADIMRTDDIPNGCLMIFWLTYTSANPVGNACYFEYGNASEVNGVEGISVFRQNGSASTRFIYRYSASNVYGVSALNTPNGQLNSCGMVIDNENDTINAHLNGSSSPWRSIDVGSGIGGTIGSRSEGLTLMSKNGGAEWLGNMGAGEHIGMKDFMVVKFTNHPGSTVINKIISDHYNIPFEHSTALIGQ